MADKKKRRRRRNKKLLMLAALAGGAALMGRRKKASIADMDDAGIGVTHSALTDTAPKTDWIKKKAPVDNVVTNVERPIRKDIYRGSGKMLSDSGQTIGAAGVDSSGLSRGERAAIMQAKANAPKGIVRPGNYTPITHGGAFGHRGAGFKKGGRVTGIAKRGFGRALMKGKK